MARADVQTNIRLPADLKERLQEAAEESGRSLSAELVQRLELSFQRTVDDKEVLKFADQMKATVERQNEELRLAKFTVATTSRILSAFVNSDALTVAQPTKEHLERVRQAAKTLANLYQDQLGDASDVVEKLPLRQELKDELLGAKK